MLNEKEAVISRVNEYAETINLAKTESIGDFYTEDAVFIPDNYKIISVADFKEYNGKGFLNTNEFKIEYSEVNVVISRDFAFVTATAKTSAKNKQTNRTFLKNSKDFFVFKKLDNQWKIFRYLFNNVNIISA